MQNRKDHIFLLSLIGFTASATAQSEEGRNAFFRAFNQITRSIGNGNPAGAVDGIGTALSSFFLWIGNIRADLPTTIIMLTFSVFIIYIVTEKSIKTAGLEDLFIKKGGYDESDSKLRLYMFTLFIFGALFVSGYLGAIVTFLAGSTILYAAILIVGFVAVVFYGFTGWGRTKISDARSIVLDERAEAKQRRSDSRKKMNRAIQEEKEAQKEAEDVRKEAESLEEAEEKVEGYLNQEDIERAKQDSEVILAKLDNTIEELETVERRVEGTVRLVEDVNSSEVKEAEKIIEELTDAQDRFASMNEDFRFIDENGNPSWNDLNATGVGDWDAAVREAENAAVTFKQILVDTLTQEDIENNLEELEKMLQNDIKILDQDVTEEEKITKKIETLAGNLRKKDDYARIEQEVQRGNSLESRMERVEKKNKELSEKVENAKTQIKELKDREENLLNIFDEMKDFAANINENLRDPNFVVKLENNLDVSDREIRQLTDDIDDLDNLVRDIENEISKG